MAVSYASGVSAPNVLRRRWDAYNYGVIPGAASLPAAAMTAAWNATASDDSIGPIELRQGEYTIASPLDVLSYPVPNVTWDHGFICTGARFLPTYNDNTKPVLKILSNVIARGLILRDVQIMGQGRANNREGNGLELECPNGGGMSIYNFQIDRPHIENVGGNNLKLIGNVFEGRINFPILRGSKSDNLILSHHASGGILSSIDIFGAVLADAGDVLADSAKGAGLLLNANDVWFHGVHCIANGSYGISCSNGHRKIEGHFENNHRLAASDALSTQQAAINSASGLVQSSYFLNSIGIGKQTHAIRTAPANKLEFIKSILSGSVTGPVGCELVYLSAAMNAGAVLEIQSTDGVRSATMRTNLGSGIVIDQGCVYPYVPSAPTAGGTTTIPNNVIGRTTLLRPASTIATHTVNLPTSPSNGQRERINTTQTIAALTYLPAVTGFTNGSALNAGASHEIMSENATWYLV